MPERTQGAGITRDADAACGRLEGPTAVFFGSDWGVDVAASKKRLYGALIAFRSRGLASVAGKACGCGKRPVAIRPALIDFCPLQGSTTQTRAEQTRLLMPMQMTNASMDDHHDAITDDHRFTPLNYGDEVWTFDHLGAFVFHAPVEATPGQTIDVAVVVFFSNHCFSREVEKGEEVDEAHVVMDGSTRRVLNKERYELSRKYLPQLILELETRVIQVADPTRPNFVTFEMPPAEPGAVSQRYAVFFEVKRDNRRKHRLLLRIQSGYVLDTLTKRLKDAEKMRFHVILKRAYNRR
jgi:hypothetical protein